MAINKESNTALQLTINKEIVEELNTITNNINKVLKTNFTKSQIVALMIQNYIKEPLKIIESLMNNKPTQEDIKKANEQPTTKGAESIKNLSERLRLLKDKLDFSYTDLSEFLSIPPSTLKKYANGTQQPKGENLEIIKKAFANYGI